MLQAQPAKRCPAFSSLWLMVMNVLYFILGIVMISLSSWGISTQGKDDATMILPAGSLNTIVASGVFLMLLSIAGCIGVKFNYKIGGRYILGIYAFFMVLVMIMEFAAAVSIFTFVGKLDDFSPAQQFKDSGIYFLINQSFADCCCHQIRCPNDTCWLSASLPYPCDSITTFRTFLSQYIEDRLQPVAGVALFLCLLQLFTSITACCNQCSGRKLQEQKSLSASTALEGLYSENDEAYAGAYGYGANYSSYVQNGNVPPRPQMVPPQNNNVAPRPGGAPMNVPPRGMMPPRGPVVARPPVK